MKLPNRLSCELGAAIKAALKSGRRRQKALAGHLGITASAVSQMLHGRLLPDREKMEAILEFLMADARLSGLLMELWRRSRLGDFPERSDFNRRFVELCRGRGLSVPQLAVRSGLTTARLRELSDDPGARPDGEERRILSGIFGCAPDDWLPDEAEQTYGDFPTPVLEAGDRNGGEVLIPECFPGGGRIEELPLLSLAELAAFSPQTDSLAGFAETNSRRSLPHLPVEAVGVVAVSADSADLGLALPGEVRLLLAEHRPPGFHKLDLAADRNGGFRLCVQERDAGKIRSLMCGRPRGRFRERWRLPVLELTLVPRAETKSVDVGRS